MKQSKIGNRKSAILFFACFLFPVACGLAQEPISASRITTHELQITTSDLPPASQPTATIVGTQGQQTYFYWVVARYVQGNASPSTPGPVYMAPNTLNGSNYIQISWNPVSNAVSYDLLRTTSPNLPASGAIAVATSLTATSFNDQGAALTAYTINTFEPGQTAMDATENGIQNFMDAGGQVFNVKSWGAKGDGVTDDTAAFNLALAAATNNGGGKLYFPPGTFNLKNPNSFVGGFGAHTTVSIECASPTSTTINFIGSSGFLLSNGDLYEPYFGGFVRGCHFELGNASAGTVALHLIDSGGWVIEGNSFDDSSAAYNRVGIEFENVQQWNERHIVENNQFYGLNPSLEFICDVGGSLSFGYNRLIHDQFQLGPNVTGILFQGDNAGNGYFYSGKIDVNANFSSAGTGTVLRLTQKAGAQFDDVNIQFEGGGSSNSGACTDASGAFLNESNVWIHSGAGNSPTICAGGAITQGIIAAYAPNHASTLWEVGSGVPGGSCTNGSLYTNTAGGSGTTLYACVAGAWADVK